MPTCKLEIDAASIVLLGSFNPAIFHPAWLGRNQLIRPEEEASAIVRVITPELADFEIGGWLKLQVLQKRFVARTNDPAFHGALKDLVASIFNLVEHTPVGAMGLNREMHFVVPKAEQWNAIGDLLVPKAIWRKTLEDPGMLSLTVQGKRDGSTSKYVRFTVGPSDRFKLGIELSNNEHFESGEPRPAADAMADLISNWDDSLAFATRTAQVVLAEVPDE